MTNSTIEALKNRYIKADNRKRITNNLSLKRNLQAEINKINSITQLISEKNIHPTELTRLEYSLNALFNVLQSVKNAKD